MFFDDLTLAIKQAIASEKIKKQMPESVKKLIKTLQKMVMRRTLLVGVLGIAL